MIPILKDGSPWLVYLNVAPASYVELFYDGTWNNPGTEQIGFNQLSSRGDIHAAARRCWTRAFHDICPIRAATKLQS